jgi:hypothetical protein
MSGVGRTRKIFLSEKSVGVARTDYCFGLGPPLFMIIYDTAGNPFGAGLAVDDLLQRHGQEFPEFSCKNRWASDSL